MNGNVPREHCSQGERWDRQGSRAGGALPPKLAAHVPPAATKAGSTSPSCCRQQQESALIAEIPAGFSG